MKQTSCGTIITDGVVILLCRATLSNPVRWDIPKGLLEPGEEQLDCAIRELYEETGIVGDVNNILDLGIFDYTPTKKLHLFLLDQKELPDTHKMSCSSVFYRYGNSYPEVDQYLYVPLSQVEQCVSYNLYNALSQALALLDYRV